MPDRPAPVGRSGYPIARWRRCCMDRRCGRAVPALFEFHAVRTEFGRSSPSMRLRTWTATPASPARRSSVCAQPVAGHLPEAPHARLGQGAWHSRTPFARPCGRAARRRVRTQRHDAGRSYGKTRSGSGGSEPATPDRARAPPSRSMQQGSARVSGSPSPG